MDVTLPNGQVMTDVPEGATKQQVMARAIRLGMADANAFRQQPEQRGSAVDALGQGASLGFSDEIAGLLGAAYGKTFGGRDESFRDIYQGVRDSARTNADQFRDRNPKSSMGLELLGGLATGGVGAGRVAAAQGTKALLGRSAATGAGLGGLSGAGYSEADSPGGLAADTAVGAGLGGAAGLAVPAIGQQLAKRNAGARVRALAGTMTDPYKRAVRLLEGKGVNLTSGQKTGANWLKQTETTLADVPFGGKPVQTVLEDQRRDWQRELFKMVGVGKHDMLTRESLEDTGEYMSRQYRGALGGKTVSIADDAFLDELAVIEERYTRLLDDSIGNSAKRIVDKFLTEASQRPNMTGEMYQRQRSLYGKMARNAGEKLAPLYDDLKNALDDAFARAAPGVKGNLDARYGQYKQLRKMFERVAGGSAGAEGFIPPGQLARLAEQNPGTKDWKEFVRAGSAVLSDRTGNSGTAARQWALKAVNSPYAAVGLLGGALTNPAMTGMALGGGAVAGAAALGGSRVAASQLAKGRVLDPSMLLYPRGNMLMNRGAGVGALAGQNQ